MLKILFDSLASMIGSNKKDKFYEKLLQSLNKRKFF